MFLLPLSLTERGSPVRECVLPPMSRKRRNGNLAGHVPGPTERITKDVQNWQAMSAVWATHGAHMSHVRLDRRTADRSPEPPRGEPPGHGTTSPVRPRGRVTPSDGR